MKWWFLAIALAAAGCMDTPTLPDEPKTKAATAVKPPQETPRALVTPDQVTEVNAYEKAEALERELTQEETRHAP